MKHRFISRLFALLAVTCLAGNAFARSATVKSFPVAPHNDVTIEWWYLNANLRTKSGHHLALIGSFFRFGNGSGHVAVDSSIKVKQSHYLIYGITDIDTKKHYAYSYGDKNTLNMLQQAASLGLIINPNSARLQQLVSVLSQGKFPPPTKLIDGSCHVASSPFDAYYGAGNDVQATGGNNNYALKLGGLPGETSVSLHFRGVKTPMLVNGDGNTGLRVRTDMKYISLTRCTVTGNVDLGNGPEPASGDGWFDHQWGNSWTTQSAGWDWWGTQLSNGTDILFFQQLDLATGKAFFPCATFETADGKQVTTHNIVFNYDPASEWTSMATGVTYPLHWTVTFPDQHVTLDISPDVLDQEMPVLASGGAIWEGSCTVKATVNTLPVGGVAYQELVGYNSPALHAGLKSASVK